MLYQGDILNRLADKNRVLRLEPIEDGGYEVIWLYPSLGGIGYVYPDSFGGWRPWSIYGKVANPGYPAYRTPIQAAYAE